QVIILLFCLMSVISGWKHSGLFPFLSQLLLKYAPKTRPVFAILIGLCFFSATLITNDVTLLIFVPLTCQLWQDQSERVLIKLIVLETIAANLGSLLTPVGNPKNLFIYDFYQMSIGEFFQITLPIWILSLVLLGLSLFFIQNTPLTQQVSPKPIQLNRRILLKYLFLFLICLLTVVKLIPALLCLGIIAAVLLATDRPLFKEIDYSLLLTFICFFIFVENMAALNTVQNWVLGILQGRVFWVGLLLSQIINDIPTTIMLASFTQESKSLLLGTNLGGLGTLIASMASLISYKIYIQRKNVQKGWFLLIFTSFNFIFLFILAFLTYYFYL
ncbi:MAG: anion permease, partial [Clostridia bacterium]|nr:anion permease [Clostridia bacterium]